MQRRSSSFSPSPRSYQYCRSLFSSCRNRFQPVKMVMTEMEQGSLTTLQKNNIFFLSKLGNNWKYRWSRANKYLRHTGITRNEHTALVQTASWHSSKTVPSFLFCNTTVKGKKKKKACFLVLEISISCDMFYNPGIRKQNRLLGEL